MKNAAPASDLDDAPWAWYTLIVLVIIGLMGTVDITIVKLLVHPIETTFRINDVGFAAIDAVPIAVGGGLVIYPAGLLADTFRRRDVILIGIVLWLVATLVSARVESAHMFFLSRLTAGIGMGIPIPAVFSMLTDAFVRTRRAFAWSLHGAGGAIAGGVALVTSGVVVETTRHNGILHIGLLSFSPWQQCFLAAAMLGAIGIALILTVPEPLRREREAGTKSNIASSFLFFVQYLRRHWLLWALLLFGTTINGISNDAIATWGPAFGMRRYGAESVSAIALLATFRTVGWLLGVIVGGFLAQRGINHHDHRVLPRMLVGIAALSCIFALSFPFMPSWPLAAIGIGGVLATTMARTLFIQIGIQETAPNEVRGQLIGLWGLLILVPGIVGPTLVGFLSSSVFAKAGGLGPALAVVGSIASIVGMLLFAISGGPYSRARHEMRVLSASPLQGENATA